MKKETKVWLDIAHEDYDNMHYMQKGKKLRGERNICMDAKKIQKQLKIFVKRVKDVYEPENIILFGSYARGEATEYSDIDILVIAKKFKGTNSYKRFSELYDLGKDLDPDFNAFGFTPSELKKYSYLTTLKDALQTGIVIS